MQLNALSLPLSGARGCNSEIVSTNADQEICVGIVAGRR